MNVVKKLELNAEEKLTPSKEEVQTIMSMKLSSYNRKEYFKSIKGKIQTLIESNQKAKVPLLDGVDAILKEMEDRVALITFETNAFRISIDDGKLERI